MKMSGIVVAALAALTLASGCGKKEDAGRPAGKQRLAVIPKGTTHVFWKSVEAGARKAAAELDVEIVWKGPLRENDRAQQIAIVEQFVSEGVDGIVLAPLDDTALLRPVQGAAAKKIPVVIFDSAIKGEVGRDFASFVATNNRQGGFLGGKRLAELLGGKGKVVLLRYLEGSASTQAREAGFLEAIAEHPGIEVTVDNRYGGATAGEAQGSAMDMLDKLREANGVFCPNESSAFGMLLALRQSGLAGNVTFVGFDASPPLIEGLRNGEIAALVVQNPTKMGYEGVATLVRHIRGESVPKEVDTGVQVVVKEDLDKPETKALLGI